jgi:hypothetical protein
LFLGMLRSPKVTQESTYPQKVTTTTYNKCSHFKVTDLLQFENSFFNHSYNLNTFLGFNEYIIWQPCDLDIFTEIYIFGYQLKSFALTGFEPGILSSRGSNDDHPYGRAMKYIDFLQHMYFILTVTDALLFCLYPCLDNKSVATRPWLWPHCFLFFGKLEIDI